MRKAVVPLGLLVILGGLFVYLLSTDKATDRSVTEIQMEDTEEVLEVVHYIQDFFSDERVKEVRFDQARKTIAVDTSLSKSDLQNGNQLEKELIEKLQVYNKSGDRISYLVEINLEDGSAFSSIVMFNGAP